MRAVGFALVVIGALIVWWANHKVAPGSTPATA